MTEPNLEAIDAQIQSQSYLAMGREIQLLDDLILHLNHGTAMLTGRQHDRGLNLLTGLLLNRAFNCLWRAREDAVRGYPGECLTLCRSALEHWATARWVEKHPRTRDRWLWSVLSEVKRPAKYPPSTDQMLKGLGNVGELPLEMYNLLSKFAHPKSIGLRWVIHFDQKSTYFHAGGHFDQRGLEMCLFFLIGIAQATLEPTAQLQYRMIGKVDSEWLCRGKKLSENAEAYWQRVAGEVVKDANQLDGTS